MKRTNITFGFILSLIIVAVFCGFGFAQQNTEGGNNPIIGDLPLKKSIEQYGITWTFDKPVPVGQFVNGDYYIVGNATVVSISPEPKDGRNGSCLNLTALGGKIGFDNRVAAGRYDPSLELSLPVSLKPGDRLFSSISLEGVQKEKPMLWKINEGDSQRTPIRTIAVITCMSSPIPRDAFRPASSSKYMKIYRARDLKRNLLPSLSVDGLDMRCYSGNGNVLLTINDAVRWFQRPWMDFVMDEFGAPVENMPLYGREFTRAVGMAGLLLCMDFTSEEKEPLLINFIQLGIDMWGLAGQGAQPVTWNALGGHANGRKWPIVFAGTLLDDKEMQQPMKKYPYLRFSEDTQTMFGECWTGAKVVWAGHVGKDGHPKYPDWGAYEHLRPKEWKGNIGESYRRCCTSNAWVAEALAARILHLEKEWNHDAFFAYVDRWMTEDDTEFLKAVKEERGSTYNEAVRQGSTWDPITKDMWKKYRGTLSPRAEDTWK